MRSRDQIEFQEVAVYGLEVSISYESPDKSGLPNINGLKIQVPDVHFPRDNEGKLLVCNWQKLYDTWYGQVKWPIRHQAVNNGYGSLSWKKLGFFRNKDEATSSSMLAAAASTADDGNRLSSSSSILTRAHGVRSRRGDSHTANQDTANPVNRDACLQNESFTSSRTDKHQLLEKARQSYETAPSAASVQRAAAQTEPAQSLAGKEEVAHDDATQRRLVKARQSYA